MIELRDTLEYTHPQTEHAAFTHYLQEVLDVYQERLQRCMDDAECLWKLRTIDEEYAEMVHPEDKYLFLTLEEFTDFLSQIVGPDITKRITREHEEKAAIAHKLGQAVFYGVWLSSIGENQKPCVMPFIHIPLMVEGHRY